MLPLHDPSRFACWRKDLVELDKSEGNYNLVSHDDVNTMTEALQICAKCQLACVMLFGDCVRQYMRTYKK